MRNNKKIQEEDRLRQAVAAAFPYIMPCVPCESPYGVPVPIEGFEAILILPSVPTFKPYKQGFGQTKDV